MPRPKVEITVDFNFSAAHRLPRYDGPCRNLHGHNYRMLVTVEAEVDDYTGMAVDFVDVQKVVKQVILDKVDHTDLNLLMENPTAEHLVLWIWGRLTEQLAGLKEIKLYETPEYSVTYRGH